MDIKKYSNYWVYLSFFVLTACPEGEYSDECVNQNIVTFNQPDLIRIYPLQETYHIGDEVTYEVIIESESDFFDVPVNIFEYSQAYTTTIPSSSLHNLLNNDYVVYYGEFQLLSELMVPTLVYYEEDDTYRFKCTIEFTETGTYFFENKARIIFEGDNYCHKVVIDRTDVLGISSDEGEFYFEVVD